MKVKMKVKMKDADEECRRVKGNATA